MNSKVAAHVANLRTALAEVELAIADWTDGTRAKYHATESLGNAREALAIALARNDDDAILRINVPLVVHTNVIWNVRSQQDFPA